MILSREAILGNVDIKTETVSCPSWGGDVIIRGLTAGERDKYEQSLYKTRQNGRNFEVIPQKENIRAKLVQLCAVDESGKRLFEPGDIESLSARNASTMDKLYEVAQRLSGLGTADMDELEKN